MSDSVVTDTDKPRSGTVHLSATAQLKVPPHSVEAEQSVLGGLMLNNDAWLNVADVLISRDFYRTQHQIIFEVMANLANVNDPLDAVTVSEALSSRGLLDKAGGISYLGELAESTPGASNVLAYAQIVRERSTLRQLISAANRIAESAFMPQGRPSSELLDMAESEVFRIHEGRLRDVGPEAVVPLLTRAVKRIEALYASRNPITGLPTGFADLDKKTAGLQPSDLIIVAGRPSMGKTSLMMNIVEHALMTDLPGAVLAFSLEMPSEQLVMRMLSSLGRIDQTRMRTGDMHDDDWPRFTSAVSQLKDKTLFIDDSPALTPSEVRTRARRVAREAGGLKLIVVDYLQLMRGNEKSDNRTGEISEISRSLKAIAKELKCPLVAGSQLNRGLESRNDKRPLMSDLRECVTGDTLVVLSDGRRVPIESLVGTRPEVLAVSCEQRIVAAEAECVWRVGRRSVFELKLASGRSLTATGGHRVLAGCGWTTLDRISVDHHIAHARADALQRVLDGKIGNGNVDTWPQSSVATVSSSINARGISTRGMSALQGTSYGAQILGDDELKEWAESDVFWDRVVEKVPAGESDVYDLTVPGPASWLADGVVCHNSGAIEQDADLILMIYRDEVYNPESPDKGTAEIIIGKQRNGPIGKVRLAFIGNLTKFENLARSDYDEYMR